MRRAFERSAGSRGCSARVWLAAIVLAAVGAVPLSATRADSAPVLLDQGWSQAEREDFWWHPQGSRILPNAWFLALERPDGGDLFSALGHMAGFGFIPAPRSDRNPDGLPIGFAREPGEGGEPWLGMTCAACHTGTLRHGGRTILIEGGAGGADHDRFDRALSAALVATRDDPARFDRFAARLSAAEPRDALRRRFAELATARAAFTAMNTPAHAFGPGRADALGVIMNAITSVALQRPENARQPDAPVSLPSVWGSNTLSRLQYNGSIANAGAGPLLRNTGQVLGVYGEVDLRQPRPGGAYASSAALADLEAIEILVGRLRPPAWPEEVLPQIDRTLAEAGRAVFSRDCAGCHQPQGRTSAGLTRLVQVQLEVIGTDPLAARNFATRTAITGALEGRPIAVFGGPTFGPRALAATIMGHVSTGVAANLPPQRLMPQLHAYRAGTAEDPVNIDGYKAPPLNGIGPRRLTCTTGRSPTCASC